MPRTYTRHEIIGQCNAALSDIQTFYQQNFVNHRGLTSDTKEPYTEIVAEFVLHNIIRFHNSIQMITRQSSYKTDSHLGMFSPTSNRVEEIAAIRMFNFCKDGMKYDHIGKVIDYQTPLKSKRSDAAGKIDLLAFDGNTLRLLELKKPDSRETMLRCVLEGHTYLKTADTEKLLKSFALPSNTDVQACPLVFWGSDQWREMREKRPQLKKLMKALKSTPYYIKDDHGSYYIMEESNG